MRVEPSDPVSLLSEKLSEIKFWQLERELERREESEMRLRERSRCSREGGNWRVPPGIELRERLR